MALLLLIVLILLVVIVLILVWIRELIIDMGLEDKLFYFLFIFLHSRVFLVILLTIVSFINYGVVFFWTGKNKC